MTHLIRPAKDSPPTKQAAAADAGGWWIVKPPRLTPRELVQDLRARLTDEFRDATALQKMEFVLLRLLQHVAYRLGYGVDRTRTIDLPWHGRTFATMERNLDDIPEEQRAEWLFQFLSEVNSTTTRQAALPRSVVFELSGTCNLNCIGCGVGSTGIQHDRFMPVSRLQEAAAILCPGADHVRINGLGEATLHPELESCLDVLEAFPTEREVITNLTAPSRTYLRLLDLGFVLLVSWDAATAPVFEAIRRNANFSDLLPRLHEVAAAAARHTLPPLVLLFTLRPQNVGELVGTVELAARAGVRRLTVNVFIRPDHTDWTQHRQGEIAAAFAGASTMARREGLHLILPDHLGAAPVESPDAHRCSASGCGFAWSQVAVRWNGDVTPCNMMNPYTYGNLERADFAAVWNGPEARCFRGRSNSGGRHPWCSGCYYVHSSQVVCE